MLQERLRANDSSTTDKQHAELMQKINDLNILRESNQSLRDEAARSAATAAQLRTKVAALEAEQTPLAERMLSLESEIDTRQHHIKLLEDDNKRWKERTEQILEKYERVDPTEMTDLKTQLEKLTSDLSASDKAKADAEKARSEAQNRFKMLQNTAREMRDTRDVAKAAKEKLEAEVTQLKAQIEEQSQTLKVQVTEHEQKTKDEHDQVVRLQQQLESVTAAAASAEPSTNQTSVSNRSLFL